MTPPSPSKTPLPSRPPGMGKFTPHLPKHPPLKTNPPPFNFSDTHPHPESGPMPYTGRRSQPLPPGWNRIRRRILQRDPTCQLAGPHCTLTSTEVDHLGEPDDHRDHMLQGVCTTCHATKTAQDARATQPNRQRPTPAHPGLLQP